MTNPIPKTRPKGNRIWRTETLKSISTPLGFYILALLIVESTLTIVLTWSKLGEDKVWSGFLWMSGIFIGVVLVVTVFAFVRPKHLLYGKEEHSSPQIDPSALKDQIEDLIHENVKTECLKNP